MDAAAGKIIRRLFVLIVTLNIAHAYSSGAPPNVCDTMTPGHIGQPLTTAIPFRLAPEGPEVEAGKTLNLILNQTGDDHFKGFMVQAYDLTDNTRIGEFLVTESDAE